MHQLTAEDHARVSQAIAQAELASDGEIVAVATELSDQYHDAAWQWAALATFLQMGIWAFQPQWLEDAYHLFFGGWGEVPLTQLLTVLLMFSLATFLIVWGALRYMPLRLKLVPPATKTRRVRRRAIDIYKAGAERRTIGRTGILIYLSMGEHRAEIIHDDAITEAVEPDAWAEAMIALLGPVKEGRVADGICAAIHEIGLVLAEHFPKSSDDTNEIPDKLIEL
ncbi:TPM domain-containing protein [Sphingomicrobium aestuariivivum]|uniref:TPM domain-containing protein n=1 Tax=Sphingomicrobium aestuariivivum TaxID=1582356 RepID=UPI001FD71EBD|nr:hypothetical protein [Sphingomicrobium aestuariivivum]MCJ8190383.1 hypothetical protein [Sphingomicrobium aestuariivivum]